MPYAAVADMDARENASGPLLRTWHAALYVLLVLTFITGASSQEHGWTDVTAQMLALPVLPGALVRMPSLPHSRVRTLPLVALAAIVMLPVLQLLPLSQGEWALAPAREALASYLAAAGVAHPVTPRSQSGR